MTTIPRISDSSYAYDPSRCFKEVIETGLYFRLNWLKNSLLTRSCFCEELYEFFTIHKEEIAKLMEDYDNHHMAIVMPLDDYERELQQQTRELGAIGDDNPSHEE